MPEIVIVDHGSVWTEEFTAIGARLRTAFGQVATRINHIGSTSVPGLEAKDVIDVQVSTASLDFDARIEQRVADAGYLLRPGLMHDHVPAGASADPLLWTKRMASERAGERRVHVHLRVAGRANERYPLLFRDYLRANPHASRSYGLIKRELASRFPDDPDAYYAVKDPVCDLIVDAAERWAVVSNWVVPPSDV